MSVHPDGKRRNGKRLAAGALLLALWIVGARWLSTSPRLVVEVAMTSDAAGTAQLFVDDGAGFGEALSARATVPGGPTLLRFTLPVRSSVQALRLDPLNVPGGLRIDSVTVTLGPERRVYRGAELERWRPAHELTTTDEDPTDGLDLTSSGRDPRLVLNEAWDAPGAWNRPPAGREILLALGALALLVLALGSASLDTSPVASPLKSAVLALTAPLLFFFGLNAAALEAWWIRDDPCLLRSTLEHGALAHFVDPAAWRGLSGSVLMPWTPLSFAVDHRLFGLEPAGFYAHQLVAFAALFGLAFLLLRRAGALATGVALSLFALSTPAFAVARQLMNRHYLEGTILALLAFLLYRRAVLENRRGAAVGTALGGAGLYFLAMSAKEVFVPLAAALPFVPVGERRGRWRRAVPFFIAAALYVPWRLYMLGFHNALSGYEGRESAGLAGVAGLARLPGQLGLDRAWEWGIAALLTAAALVFLARRHRAWLPFAGVLAVALALPLLPILGELGPRHFFLPGLALAALFGVAVQALGRFRAPAALALALASLAALEDAPLWRHHPAAAALYESEGRYVFASDAGETLLTRLPDTQYLRCTAALRRLVGRPSGPGYCGDPCFCATRDATPGCAVPRELEVAVGYEAPSGRLEWSFAPFEEGSWSLLLIDRETPGVSPPVPLTPTGSAPLHLDAPWPFVVRYAAPDGSYSYSPVLTLDPRLGPRGRGPN